MAWALLDPSDHFENTTAVTEDYFQHHTALASVRKPIPDWKGIPVRQTSMNCRQPCSLDFSSLRPQWPSGSLWQVQCDRTVVHPVIRPMIGKTGSCAGIGADSSSSFANPTFFLATEMGFSFGLLLKSTSLRCFLWTYNVSLGFFWLAFCFVPCDFCLELPQAILVTRKEGKAHSSSSDGRGHAGNRSTDDSAGNRKAAEDSREQPLVAMSGNRGGRGHDRKNKNRKGGIL